MTRPIASPDRKPRTLPRLLLAFVLLTSIAIARSGRRDLIPTPEAQARALEELKTIYKAEYAAAGNSARRALAKEVFRLGAEKNLSPVEAYVALDQARQLAVLGQDLPGAFVALRELEARFELPVQGLYLAAILEVAGGVPQSEVLDAAEAAGRYVDQRLAVEDWASVEQALENSKALLRRLRDDPSKAAWGARQRALTRGRELAQALAALAVQPSDPDANQLVGKLYCFDDGDFERGLPHLAKGPEGELRGIVVLDLNQPQATDARLALAEQWLAWGKKQRGLHRLRGMARARSWFEACLPDLGDTFRARGVERRTSEIDAVLLEPDAVALLQAPPGPATLARLRTELLQRLSRARSARGSASEEVDQKRVSRAFELRLTDVDPTSGTLAGEIVWSGAATGTNKLEGSVELREDGVLLWFRETEVVEPGSAETDGTYYFMTARSPRASAQLTGSWTRTTRGGEASLTLANAAAARPASAKPERTVTAPAVPKTPDWAEVLDRAPDPKVVTDARMREAIAKTGLPWRVRERASGIELLLVAPGKYRRGASPDDAAAGPNEGPAHDVVLTRPFYLGRFEVQQHEWRHVMNGDPARPGELGMPFKGPVNAQVRDFLGRCDGLRLATEAEWEYACRAGTTGATYGELHEIAWSPGNADGVAHPVGGKRANAWGFHDMLGNVWELCQDTYAEDEYSRYANGTRDPSGPEAQGALVIRGGSYNARYDDRQCRASGRGANTDQDRFATRGFRVARSP